MPTPDTQSPLSPSDAHDPVLDQSPDDSQALSVSFFIPDLSVGGAEQVTVNIANGLASRGYNVELLLSRAEGELKPNLDSEITVVELPPSRTSVFGVGAHLPALIAYVRDRKPDVLIPHLRHPSIVALTLKRLFDTETAIIPTHHSAFGVSTEQSHKDRLVDWLVPRLYPAADRIIAVSEGVARGIVDRTPVDRTQITVLHNPVEIEAVRDRARDPVDHRWIEDEETDVVLFVGRLADQKGLDTWLRAFKLIHEQNPNTRGIIVGKGPRSEKLQQLAQELGIADVVDMPGYVENPYRYMDRSAVFLLTSKYEGLPTVLIEALACGCQVVATDCDSGPREILKDGSLGALAPVGDERALADAVCETLTDPIDTETLRARADDFAPSAVLDRYEQFLEEYVGSAPTDSRD